MGINVSKKTMYSETDDDDLDLIIGIGIFVFFLNLFLLCVYAAVAIRHGHWEYIAADLLINTIVLRLVSWPWTRKDTKYQRHMRLVMPQILVDAVIWIVMAVNTGFSWTLVTYTMYLMVNWPLFIALYPAYYESKEREAKKEAADAAQT
jgi:hypothetical protein